MTLQDYQTALNDIQEAYLNWRIDAKEFKAMQEDLLRAYEDANETL